ncbi:7TM GPCR, serpentine receptor class v (Srv) family-containing protein [Strongyloides ratti]|uniref:7TM GPCR, serpentine receptor class v (Srv) family-containing protein n=1 Tax=Strongyloides ratti TaxID=34506 RepID=A0A090KZ02_STRRB|nr:7TM GPCR, serpentine receptor class v (Srv) family-containing protein [Strongyloides ratti]CEF61112.1 7TM GPCR, serpentine receptor class v (Srv) family-containing protein [Strongyloides ratti]
MKSFYISYFIAYGIDVIEIFKTKIFFSFPSYGWFISILSSTVASYTLPILSYVCTHASALDSVCLALHTSIAITFPIFYKIKWSKWTIKVNLILQLFLPICVFSYEFGKKAKLKYYNGTNEYAYSMEDPYISRLNNTIAPIFSTLILFSNIFLNLYNFYKIIFSNKKNNGKVKNNHWIDLLIYSSISTIGISTITTRYWIKFIGVYKNSSSIKNFGQSLGVWTSTIESCSKPYLLMLSNKKLRDKFLRFLIFKNTTLELSSNATINDGTNAFYKTYIIGFFGNVLEILKTKIFYFIPSFGWFINFYQYNPIPLYTLPVLGYTCTFISILGIFCLSINRTIAILYPMFYRIKWSSKIIYITIFIQFFTPFIIFSYEYGRQVELKYDNATQIYVYSMKEPEISKINNIVSSGLSAIILIIQIFSCYISLSNSIKIERKNNYNLSLTIYCCCGTIAIFIVSLRFWIKLFAVYTKHKVIRNLAQSFGTYSSTISTTCQPYLLLISSKKLRNEFLNFICFSLFQIKKNVIITETAKSPITTYFSKFNKKKVEVY